MKKYFAVIAVVLMLGMSIWNVPSGAAKEHGGSGHEHGGKEMSHMKHLDKNEVKTIQESADALRVTNPELAEKLDAIVAQEKK